MYCPACESGISRSFLREEDIDGGDTFECQSCGILLRYIVDEGTYLGAQEESLEIVDDEDE
ncbi:hypothetical protein [Marinibactrum halimedae]|uniref:Uncharacterized protein n=1 Tax=Marinibactrum halimedae TaxID=1444977 RepID=A0AA37TG01_9GAMM|nr:hypothetical protein [Marinibactrum halimedae]MCD9461252.1 hypothetical protein [Marinibactrum halimedae]GLS28287.1 hypothetical protein GCM10007877_40070 [Marinibactrum halimedae]